MLPTQRGRGVDEAWRSLVAAWIWFGYEKKCGGQKLNRRVGTVIGQKLSAAVLAVGLAAAALTGMSGTAANAAPGDLEEWSGTVLGGTEISMPNKTRKIEFDEIYSCPNCNFGRDTDGYLWGWGLNGYGNLGNDDYIGYFVFAPTPCL